MNIKNLMKNPLKYTILVLCQKRFFNWLPDKQYIKLMWFARMGSRLDLENPVTFNEKLQWLKLNYRNPLMTTCCDKYEIRSYAKSCGLGNILNELYGVYDSPEEIDFEELPETCFIKTNNGCGSNYIYKKNLFKDRDEFNKLFDKWLLNNSYYYGREWPYKNIQPKIVVEKVLRDNKGKLPVDYKFFCFGGRAEFVFINDNVCSENGKHRSDDIWNIFDLDMKPLDFSIRVESKKDFRPAMPKNWRQMIEISEKLAEPFPHARVDLYNIDGKIILGEITFFHCSGFGEVKPYEWNKKLGDLIKLEKYV